jgi:uncharacterized protein (DUF697 family)/cell wall-associated NlpC family hydrolase
VATNTDDPKEEPKEEPQKVKVSRKRRRLYETGSENDNQTEAATGKDVESEPAETAPSPKTKPKAKAKAKPKSEPKSEPKAKKTTKETAKEPVKTPAPESKAVSKTVSTVVSKSKEKKKDTTDTAETKPKDEPKPKTEPKAEPVSTPAAVQARTPEPEAAPVETEMVEVEVAGSECLAEANSIVKKYVYFSFGTSFLPLPLLDTTLLVALNLKMIHSLSKIYNVPYNRNLGKSIVLSLLGGINAFSVSALTIRGLLKIVPGAGYLSGLTFISVSAITSSTTYAIGKVFISHFESGGNLLNLRPEKFKDFVNEKVEERLKKDKD